jgi:hypothetical protein
MSVETVVGRRKLISQNHQTQVQKHMQSHWRLKGRGTCVMKVQALDVPVVAHEHSLFDGNLMHSADQDQDTEYVRIVAIVVAIESVFYFSI